jgi:hypothetical protein
MNRPTSITIGPYQVTVVSDRKTDKVLDDLERRGDSDLTRCVIRLHSELSDDAWAETLEPRNPPLRLPPCRTVGDRQADRRTDGRTHVAVAQDAGVPERCGILSSGCRDCSETRTANLRA